MSLPRYSEYKDSGVDWLGEVPGHWEITRLQDVAAVLNGYPFDARLFDTNGTYPLIRIRDLDASETVTRYNGEFVNLAAVTTADVLIGMDGDFNVGRWLGNTPALLNQRMCCIRAESDDLLTLLRYALPTPLQSINDVTYATTVKHLSSFQVQKIRLALPTDKRELSAIAAFLDRETAKIDGLIAEQEKLIALLAEKRQATISHAVTKGLNPAAPMKDSGVAWLGEVPAHWGNSKKLLDLAHNQRHSFVNGPFGSDLLTSELVSEGVPVVYIRDIKPNGYVRVSEWCVTTEKAEQLKFCNVLPGDIIVAKVGEPPGLAAVYPTGEPEAIVTQDVIRLRVASEKAKAEYIRWLLNSKYGQTLIDNISVEATRTRVSLGEYKQLRFYVPPLPEQIAITSFLDTETIRLNELTAEATRGIALLKERRSALISAAVTGKIDVREAA